MENLNQIEIQNIRHICGHGTGFCSKINYYKTLTSDSKVVSLYEDICNALTSDSKVVSLYDEICNELDNLKSEISNLL